MIVTRWPSWSISPERPSWFQSGRGSDGRKTDMFSLGFYLRGKWDSKHPKRPKHVCWRGRKELLGWERKGRVGGFRRGKFCLREFSSLDSWELVNEGLAQKALALGDRHLAMGSWQTCSWAIWHMLATCLLLNQALKKFKALEKNWFFMFWYILWLLSGLHAAWQRTHRLGWQHLGSRHLAVKEISFECPKDVKKNQ